MPRHTGELVFKLRSRKTGKRFGTKFIIATSHSDLSSHSRLKTVKIEKVSKEELFHTGDHCKFNGLTPDQLLVQLHREGPAKPVFNTNRVVGLVV